MITARNDTPSLLAPPLKMTVVGIPAMTGVVVHVVVSVSLVVHVVVGVVGTAFVLSQGVVPPFSSHSHFSVTVRVVIGTRSNQFVRRVRHCSRTVTVLPPSQTAQG